MTVKPPAPPPLPDELDRLLRRLRLPYVRRAAPEVIAHATAQRWEHAEVLRVLLAEEAAGRDQATIRMRRRASGLPSRQDLRRLGARPLRDPSQGQRSLRTLEWIDRAEVLCVCGPSQPAAGASLTLTIVATVPADTADGTLLLNVATVHGNEDEPAPTRVRIGTRQSRPSSCRISPSHRRPPRNLPVRTGRLRVPQPPEPPTPDALSARITLQNH